MIENIVARWLQSTNFTEPDKRLIIGAVLNHERPNEDNDGPVTIALKDADRVVNAALDVVIRSGQFQPDLPVIDFKLLLKDKRGKYNSRFTIIADLTDCLDWAKEGPFYVRTQLARNMIRKRVAQLGSFLNNYVAQLEEEKVFPYPFSK